MCYDAISQTKEKLLYAKRVGTAADEIEELERQLRYFQEKYLTKHYHASGFSHPKLLVVTNEEPKKFDFYQWGLIPFWCKDKETAQKMWNNTINCRGETMFEKPSFREPAKKKRCLVFLDGFYEHHHYKGKTYPFKIELKNGEVMPIAGLWDSWVDKETGEETRTLSIVTTKGNSIMTKIHNNPKLEFGPRMPLILPDEIKDKWLMPINDKVDQEELQSLMQPYPEEEMVYHTAPRLRGKEAIGNVPEALNKCDYPELVFDDNGNPQMSLF